MLNFLNVFEPERYFPYGYGRKEDLENMLEVIKTYLRTANRTITAEEIVTDFENEYIADYVADGLYDYSYSSKLYKYLGEKDEIDNEANDEVDDEADEFETVNKLYEKLTTQFYEENILPIEYSYRLMFECLKKTPLQVQMDYSETDIHVDLGLTGTIIINPDMNIMFPKLLNDTRCMKLPDGTTLWFLWEGYLKYE